VRLPVHYLKAFDHLSTCRTAALGGHSQYCEQGHLTGVWYNSCRHRFCPQCRSMATEQWLVSTKEILLNCAHHHVIFTMPSELNELWRFNKGLLNNLLFKAAQETLKQFAKDRRYLGAMAGILCALHSWGRNLSIHPHIHAVISHGGIDSGGVWVMPKKKVLFPQKPVMMVFRGKLLSMIKAVVSTGQYALPPAKRASEVSNLLNKLGRQAWVVHFCPRYEHAQGVAKYLSRYVKSGPFKNRQLKRVGENEVRFSYYSHRHKKTEFMSLPLDVFVHRLLEHVPEPGKPMVRYSGLYNSAARKRLNKARESLGQEAVSERQVLDWQVFLSQKGGLPQCRMCGSGIGDRGEVVAKKMKV